MSHRAMNIATAQTLPRLILLATVITFLLRYFNQSVIITHPSIGKLLYFESFPYLI